jgi:hypothetical protein
VVTCHDLHPVAVLPETVTLATQMRADGVTYNAIADHFIAHRDDHPTASGRGQWTRQTVFELLNPGWRAQYQRTYRRTDRGGWRW